MLTIDAVAYFKGKSKLAAALEISPAAVSQWPERVPKARQFQLQVLSGGVLKAETKGADRRRNERRKADRRTGEERRAAS